MEKTEQNKKITDFSPTLLRTYPEELIANQARIECGETPEKVRDGLAIMKKSIRKHKLKCPEDDEYLIKFLRVKKFRHPDSYKMLEGFTKCLKAFAEKIGYPEKEGVEMIFRKNVCGILSNTDAEGRPVLFTRFGIYYKEGLTADNTGKATQIMLYAMMEQPVSQSHGITYIVDCKEIGLRDLYDSISTGILYCRLLGNIPIRIHRLDILHDSAVFRMILNVLKSFIPIKILQRMHFHGDDVESVAELYGRSLPNEFGGTAGPLSNDHWMNKLDNFLQNLIKLQEKAASS